MLSRIRTFRVLMVLAAFVVLQASFMNCGKGIDGQFKSSSAASKGTGGGTQNNGGGYSGKVDYLFFAADPLCARDPQAPDAKIEFSSGIFLSQENMCSNQGPSYVVTPGVSPYNPYFIIHNEKVYFRDQGQTQLPAGKRVVTHALCVNGPEQTDVAIRIEKNWNASTLQWDTLIKGQLIRAGQPMVEESGRLTDPDSNGTVRYGYGAAESAPATNTFRLRVYNYGSGFQVTGEIELLEPNLRSIPATCYILK
jgi:hypothetical protein